MIRKVWKSVFVAAFEEGRKVKALKQEDEDLKRILWVVLTAAIVLSLNYYLKNAGDAIAFLEKAGLKEPATGMDGLLRNSVHGRLWSMVYWAVFLSFTYLFFPILVIKLVFRDRISQYGVKPSGIMKGWRIYFLFFFFMLPLVIGFSFTEGFQLRYPFYKPVPGSPLWPDFFIWEFFYFLQFAGLEFFFRGFLVHALKKHIGYYSVLLAMIPYCMIHFGKPFPETMGAILAGLALGSLSLKSKNIFPGIAIHYSVALTMDVCALWHMDFLSISWP